LLPLSSSAAADSTESGLKLQMLIAVLVVVLVVLQYLLWLSEDGVRQTHTLRIAIQAQTEENVALNERNRALEADVIDLKSGLMAIEERARSEMGMVRPDETFYRILDHPLPKPIEVVPAKPVAAPPRKPPAPAKPPVATAKPPVATAKPPVATTKPPVATAKPPVATAKPVAAKPSIPPASPSPNVAKPPANLAQPR
jgi:cell division protein FtsB